MFNFNSASFDRYVRMKMFDGIFCLAINLSWARDGGGRKLAVQPSAVYQT